MDKYSQYGKNAWKAKWINRAICIAAVILVGTVAIVGYNTVKPKYEAFKVEQAKKEAEQAAKEKEDTNKAEEAKKAQEEANKEKENAEAEQAFAPAENDSQEVQQEKVWSGARSRSEQQAVMDSGNRLDTNYLTGVMAGSGAAYSAYVLDVANMEEYDGGYSDVPMPASALIGVPILFTLADCIDNGTYTMEDTAVFRYTFPNGRGNIKQEQDGQSFTLGQLMSEALLYSDNNALNSMMDFLTLDRINNTCHTYGFESVDMQRKLMLESTNLENYISAKDVVLMLNSIYQNNFNGINRDFLMSYFKIQSTDSANKGMYPACAGYGTFLNLNGVAETRYTETGLVENGDQVYIMAVLADGVKQEVSSGYVTSFASYVVNTL